MNHRPRPPLTNAGLTSTQSRFAVTLGAISLGLIQGLSFAPIALWWLQLLSFSGLCIIILRRPALAVWATYWFALACFSAGLSWLFISMNRYGGMPAPMAALAVVLLSAYLAAFGSIAIAVVRRLIDAAQQPLAFCLAFAGTWALLEIFKGVFLTGFPWLSIGYAHVDSPLAVLAPLIGVYGIGAVAVLVSASLGLIVSAILPSRGSIHAMRPVAAAAVVLTTVLVVALMNRGANYAQPDGAPISIRLIQGNVAQNLKFDPSRVVQTMRDYATQVREGSAQLHLIPETAWVVSLNQTPQPILNELTNHLKETGGLLSIGMPVRDRNSITNSVRTIDQSGEHINLYSKRHLVPFGEFVPFGFQWFIDMMHIPLGNFDRGATDQPMLTIEARKIGFNICYEDLFGEELAHQVRMGAGILANVSNLAWFGESHALAQHLNIARMRSIELQRPMVRSTNTGVTAHISSRGEVVARLAANVRETLNASVQPMRGLTPYARYGLVIPIVLGMFLVIVGAVLGRIGRRRGDEAA